MNNINAQSMVAFAEEAVIQEVRRQVREKIKDAIMPVIDKAVDDICKDLSGEAVIERDCRTMQDFLLLAVSRKPPITPTDGS